MSAIGLRSQRKRGGGLVAACQYALIALFVITPVLGREISDAERGALKTALSEFSAAIKESDFTRQISGSLPPRVLELLANKGGITVEVLREQMIVILKTAMQVVTIESFAFDLERAEFGALASGEPYALIPTRTVIVAAKSPRILAKEKTLAMIENGKWYLVRVSDPNQAALFREAYPEFAQVGLPNGTTEILKNEP